MALLKALRYGVQTVQPPELSRYLAWLEPIPDNDVRSAVLAANVNILRRYAPYAYFFANGFTEESWHEEDIGDESGYIQSLETQELGRGIWFSQLDFEGETSTVVTAIFEGDVLPIVHLLDEEEFAVLCLPSRISVKRIDEIVTQASSNKEAVKALLADGGCVATAIDEVSFAIWTTDVRYARYFTHHSSG
jgi:hypothetical protein